MKLLHQENPNIQFNSRDTLDFPQHLHDVLEIVFLHQGTATVICGSRRYRLVPGDVFVSFPNQPHGYENSHDTVSDVLIIPATPYLAPWRNEIHKKLPRNPVLKSPQWAHTGIRTLLEMIRPERKTMPQPVLHGYAMVITGKLLPLLECIDQPSTGGDTLMRLLRHVNEHYREPLSRTDIAQAVGYNESYVSHLFTESLGTTLKDYITSLRLKDARALLTDTDMTVSQVCMTTGFGSIRSFNRAFLKEFGISPSGLRHQSR